MLRTRVKVVAFAQCAYTVALGAAILESSSTGSPPDDLVNQPMKSYPLRTGTGRLPIAVLRFTWRVGSGTSPPFGLNVTVQSGAATTLNAMDVELFE